MIWIDDEETARDKGRISGGVVSVDLDLASLSAGLHRLALRVSDSRGVWSSPRTNFFIGHDTLPAGNGISAYSYWFNRGPRVRVNVNTVNPLVVSDLWIEVKDVVPNRIPSDCRFDTATGTLYCDDDVFFGIQAYDMAGSPTEAVLSDTFRMTVSVTPDFVDLADGVPVAFAAPEAGIVCRT